MVGGLWLAFFACLFALAPSLRAHEVYLRWLGDTILAHHAIPTALGNETFTATGAPFVAPGWLGAIAIATCERLSPAMSAAAQFILAVSTLALIGYRAWRTALPRSGSLAGVIAVVLATLLIAEQARPGGEFGSWFLGALLATLPVRGELRLRCIVVVLASILWANVSEVGVLAPIVVLLAQWSDGALPSRASFLAVIALLSILVNPAGIALIIQSPGTLEIDRSLMLVRPQLPSYNYPATYRYGLPIFVAATAFASWLRRNTTAEALAIAVSVVALLSSGRFFALAALMVVPIIARSIAAALSSYELPRRIAAPIGAAGLLLAALISGADYRTADVRVAETNRVPELAAQLDARPGSHRVMCLDQDADECDAFLPYAPHVRTFIDERVGAYPPKVRARAFLLSESPSAYAWLAQLKRERIDAIVVHRGDPRVALAESRAWRAVGLRGELLLLART